MPILVEFNDHLDQQRSRSPGQLQRLQGVHRYASTLRAVTPRCCTLQSWASIGNSHMVMLDKNNLQIADLILKWIDEHVGKKKQK